MVAVLAITCAPRTTPLAASSLPAGLSGAAAAPAAAGGANTAVDIDSYAGASLTDKLAAAAAENQ